MSVVHFERSMTPRPFSLHQSPRDLLADADLSVAEKRRILADWSSDRFAVEAKPWLRQIPGVVNTLVLAEILEALRDLDGNDWPPGGGKSAPVPNVLPTAAPDGAALVQARIAAHKRNVDRYCRLLATEFSALEREFIQKRIAEERTQLEALYSTLPSLQPRM